MEPVTIVSIIAAAGTVAKMLYQSGESLHQFIQRTKEVDQTIHNLHRGILGLKQTVTNLRAALQQLDLESNQTITDDYASVWTTLQTSLHECSETATTMVTRFRFEPLVTTSFWARAWRQHKLDFKLEDINTWKGDILVHTSQLVLSLEMINLIISITSPTRILESILPRLDLLIAMQNAPLPQSAGRSESIQVQQQNERLRDAAQVVATSASTIIEETRSTLAARIPQGGPGSELGTPLDEDQIRRIRKWIPPPDIMEEGSIVDSESTAVDLATVVHTTAQSTMSFGSNLDIETTDRLWHGGRIALAKKRFESAIPQLSKAVARMKRLPTMKQNLSHLGQCELLLAYALLRIHLRATKWSFDNWMELYSAEEDGECDECNNDAAMLEHAERLFLEVTGNSSTPEDFKLIGYYGLCRVYFHQCRYDEAYELCHEKVDYLKVDGIFSWFQYTSQKEALLLFLMLLSSICRLRGDYAEASVYDDIRAERLKNIGLGAKSPSSRKRRSSTYRDKQSRPRHARVFV